MEGAFFDSKYSKTREVDGIILNKVLTENLRM
jgi:hypothetical protein